MKERKVIIFEIDANLKNTFKAVCSQQGLTIKKVVISLIQKWTFEKLKEK